MSTPKSILVTTTPTLEGIPIKSYLKPISAHVVSGINVFGDILGSFSDFFGGRSQTYQRQIASIYDESIERLKRTAYELGANGIVGLSIDVDEISGKGKSMIMITATGTAVILSQENKNNVDSSIGQQPGVVTKSQIDIHNEKTYLLAKAAKGSLGLTKGVWDFISLNAIPEFYPVLMKQNPYVTGQDHINSEETESFISFFSIYLNSLPEDTRKELLYASLVDESKPRAIEKTLEFIIQGNLYDEKLIYNVLNHPEFKVRKRGIALLKADKPFYHKEDVGEFEKLKRFIEDQFPARGEHTTKQGFLSSKQKPAWKCECGKTNEMGSFCTGCDNDIYGFSPGELSPPAAVRLLLEKIEVIKQYLA